MNNIERLTVQLAQECRERGLNFVIVIEDKEIYNQYSVKGETVLREMVKVLKKATKTDQN